ncbi:hypothetical protein DGG96_08415 [Legionella qingyii]|uniref:Uncharacterized protein n=1 Tax=Legionella qingyii TaxID=2184757 RepID=A0A317U5P3_9GAMM|nr:hypothetical protein [Legionella qingyii]PWY56156.1 hypothetical protein DGG96_08415 [Legionella qingyii]
MLPQQVVLGLTILFPFITVIQLPYRITVVPFLAWLLPMAMASTSVVSPCSQNIFLVLLLVLVLWAKLISKYMKQMTTEVLLPT